MKDYGLEEPRSEAPKGASRVWASLALLASGLVSTVPVYGQWFHGGTAGFYRFALMVLWGTLALAASRSKRWTGVTPALWGLFGVSLGLALAYVVQALPLPWLRLSTYTPKGAAAAKVLTEVLPVCLGIGVAGLLARRDLASFGLGRGRVWLGLGLGLLASVPLFVVFAADPSGGLAAVQGLSPAVALSWLPWIALYSVTNGFMEELWFRGSWFGGFREVLGSSAAMHVTSVVFCLLHVLVYWHDPTTVLVLTPVWLYLGYACCLIVRKTGSIWGAVLTHAIADVIFMYVYFAK